MNNRLYCTFTNVNDVDETLNTIKTSYVILFNKIFILESLDGEKIMLTYNVDMGNSSKDTMVDNTILVHRKKQTNTLYTINALNELIKSLNNGVIDKSFAVNWNDYRNCILLIQTDGFNRIDTKVKEIINLQQKNLVQPKMLHILNEVIKEYSHLIKKSYEFR